MVSRCTCGFSAIGAAGEVRERLRSHRAAAHPERPLIALRPKPKPKPKPTRAQIEEGRRLSRSARPKRKRPSGRRGRPSKLSDLALVRQLHEQYVNSDARYGTKPLVEGVWRELGYASAASCAGALRALWRRMGLPIRPRGGYRGPLPDRQSLSLEQAQVVRELWAAGARTSRIARLCWREWGYAAETGLEQALCRIARRLPDDERPILDRRGPRRWVGSISEEEAQRMLLAVAPT